MDEFRNLVLKQANGAIVRLKDVANVTLGFDDYETEVGFDGQQAVYLGIQVAPSANLLNVINGVHAVFPGIQAQLPEGLNGQIVYDSTEFVSSAIHEVVRTLVMAVLIVTLVVFVFLGSPRSVLIPVIAIPLSLIGTFTIMLVSGFSINLLTLLALVLAIGLVVDDAIIVVENVNRHLEEGMKPIPAAMRAAHELAGPIIAMTVVLIAVYVPIGFQGGLTGALFTEFAFTLVGAITVSAIIALTLSPMMTSRLLRPAANSPRWEAGLINFIDRRFASIHRRYERWLHGSLSYLPVTTVFALIILGSIYFLYNGATSELAPQEDQGVVITSATTAADLTLQQRQLYDRQIYEAFASYPESDHIFQLDMPGQNIAGAVLKPWDKRDRTTGVLQPLMQQKMAQIAGAQVVAFQPPPLPGSQGLPIQFIIGTTDPFSQLNTVAQKFLQDARASGLFIFLDTDLKLDKPQTVVQIDRSKAALLGLKMSDVGGALTAMLGGGYVNYFGLDERSYKVIPQVQQRDRLNPSQLMNYYIRTASGASVPLSTIATLSTHTAPESLNHFQQINDAMIQGVAAPGVALGTVIQYLQELAARELPAGLFDRLRRAVAAIRAGVGRLRGDLRLCADHHLSVARGAVRKLPRSVDHPGLRADVDCRCVVLRGPRARWGEPEHLHRGRPGHADGPDQQARHPDRGIRQQPAEGRPYATRGHRDGGWHPVAADPDDDCGDGAWCCAADCRHRRRRGFTLQHGSGDRYRPVHRHAVHAVRGARGVYADRRGPSCARARGRAGAGGVRAAR